MGDTEDCLLLPCPHGHVTLEADDCCPALPAWSLDMMGLAQVATCGSLWTDLFHKLLFI